jgi:hypothetical protein
MAITKVTNSLVATNAIQGTLIADNAITSVHIAQNQVTAVQIPDGSITSTQLGANSVDSSELVDGSIDTSHIADAQITTAKLGTNQVTSAKIAQNSIEARHIADGSITDTQLGSGAFTMGTITTTGAIRGPASLTIDPATVGDNTGTVVIAGNLQVDGTTTTINSTQLSVADKKITVGKGSGSSSAANESGFEVGVGADGASSNPSMLYSSSGTKFVINKPLDITGNVTATRAVLTDGITDTGQAGSSTTFNNGGTTADFIVKSSGNATMLVVDGGTNRVGIGTSTPAEMLNVESDSASPAILVKAGGQTSSTSPTAELILSPGSLSSNDSACKVIAYRTGDYSSAAVRSNGLKFQTTNANAPVTAMTITNAGNVGIGAESPDTLLELRKDTDSSGYGAYPTLSIRNDNAAGYGAIHFQEGSTQRARIEVGNNSGAPYLGLYTTSGANGLTVKSTGHVQLSASSSFAGLNNSLLGSSNGYQYFMGGTAGLYLGDNSALHNAIGIRDANYIDFTTGGISTHKFDTAGIHFQRADGQAITAKESLVMTVDADNNTASRVFQVNHGNGKTLLNLHDDYRTDVGTLQFSSTRSAGASQSNGLGASAGDWVDIAEVPYGRNIATIKIFWDAIYAPSSSHHGNMEFDIGSHYGTSYYYGWDSYITLKASSAHNSFFISEARIISPGGSSATGYFQVKFGVATGTQGTLRAYVTHRDEQCSIDPITPVVNNSRSGTTIAQIKLDTRPSFASSRDIVSHGKIRACYQPAFFATLSSSVTAPSNLNSDIVFNTETLDQGGCYTGSNGRFTAPCDGVFSFGINLLVYPHTNGVLTPWFYKNGSGYGTASQQGHEGSSHTAVIRQTIIKLDKGDYVTVRMSLGGGNSGANIYGGQSSFHGHMIG